MEAGNRRAKVTPETKKEAERLRQLWETKSHPTQQEFGELYEIGNQSAVGQFLRGVTPLSLKAARGFAKGLGVRLEEFSPRLAEEASRNAGMVAPDALSEDVATLARDIDTLTGRERSYVLRITKEALKFVRRGDSDSDSEQPQRRSL